MSQSSKKKLTFAAVLVLTIGSVSSFLPGHLKAVAKIQNAAEGEIISRDEVVVKDFPLNELIHKIFALWNVQLVDHEPLPVTKVSLSMKGNLDDYKRILGKYGLIFQPIPGEPLDQQEPASCDKPLSPTQQVAGDGSTPGPSPETQPPAASAPPLASTSSSVCLALDQPIQKGEIRFYREKDNTVLKNDKYIYFLATESAPVAEVLKRIEALYPGSSLKFRADIEQDLARLGVALSQKITIKERFQCFSAFSPVLVRHADRARLAAEDDLGPDHWPLTFIQPLVGPAENVNDGVSTLVKYLNTLYKEKVQVEQSGHNLLIFGPSPLRRRIRQLLALIDVPSPQVRMDAWTIQVTGKPEEIAVKGNIIKKDIELTREAMAKVQIALRNVLLDKSVPIAPESLTKLKEMGLIIDRQNDPLSLNEILILLACWDKGGRSPFDKVEDAQKLAKALKLGIKLLISIDKIRLALNSDVMAAYERQEQLYRENVGDSLISHLEGVKDESNKIGKNIDELTIDLELLDNIEKFSTEVVSQGGLDALSKILKPEVSRYSPKPVKTCSLVNNSTIVTNETIAPQVLYIGCKYLNWKEEVGSRSFAALPRLLRVYSTAVGANQAIQNLGNAWAEFKKNEESGPDNLRRHNAILDRMLLTVTEAYAADIQEIFLDPLLDRIRAVNKLTRASRTDKGKGASINGRVRMVVSSRIPSKVVSTMASYANITRPAPVDIKTIIDNPITTGNLMSAFLRDTPPVFREVSPGVDLHIQPTVLPDSGSARLAIVAKFKVDTKISGTQDVNWKQPEADAIKSHDVFTDAVVNAFDLFEISSFSLESAYPQAPFSIPVLGQLPAIGAIFQLPRDKKRVHHESIILINTVILPRALDLALHYGN